MTAAEITALLRSEGLEPTGANEEALVWGLQFTYEDRKQLVLLALPQGHGQEYLVMMSLITAAKVAGKSLDVLPAETLRTIIRVASEVPLAKVLYQAGDQPMLLATSECSVDAVTGHKLRNRLEACARLAIKLQIALM
jgi:hypothetical protein